MSNPLISSKSINLAFKDSDLVANLIKLTLPSFSEMKNQINQILNFSRAGIESDGHIILAKVDDDIVGWSLLQENMPEIGMFRGTVFMVFVKPQYRRMKIGTALINKAKELVPSMYVYPHDYVSSEFFIKNYDTKILKAYI